MQQRSSLRTESSRRATGALGVDAATIAAADTVSSLGDTGAASAFLGAATAFADGAERVLIAAYGSGASATLFVATVPFRSTLRWTVQLPSYAAALRRRGTITGGEPAGGGAYVSVPTWKRTIPQRHRLVAGECAECGALSFPPEGACTDCGSLQRYEAVELPGTGRRGSNDSDGAVRHRSSSPSSRKAASSRVLPSRSRVNQTTRPKMSRTGATATDELTRGRRSC